MLTERPPAEFWARFEAPECACEGTGLVIEVADSGSGYYRPGFVDDYGGRHGEPCPCSKARAAFVEANTCAHCGALAEIVAHVTPEEAVCRACVGSLT